MGNRMPKREKVVRSQLPKLLLAARHGRRVVVQVVRKYSQDRGPLIAAAVSFFALLSIIPLVLLGVWGLGHFLSSHEAFEHVVDYLEAYLPGSSDVLEPYLQALVKSRGTIGWLAAGGLVWSASQGFVILELAINMILRAPQRRSFIKSRLLGFGMILLAGGSLLLSLLITSTLTAIQSYSLPVVGWRPGEIPVVWSVVGVVVPISLTILSFSVVYRVVPNTRVSWRSALLAGTIAGLFWELAKRAFTWYLPTAAGTAIKQLYGSVAGLIGLVVWIYYSSIILVLGAELLSILQDIDPIRREPGARRPAPRKRGH
jgi:YihY family inner membrane protein